MESHGGTASPPDEHVEIYGVLGTTGRCVLLAPPPLHSLSRPHLDDPEQQADADEEEHTDEQEAGEQVSCKAGWRLRRSPTGLWGTRLWGLLVWDRECTWEAWDQTWVAGWPSSPR